MEDKYYCVSKESLAKLLYYSEELFEVGAFIQGEYHKEVEGDFCKEILSDGVYCRLKKHYDDIYKLINIICNDDKLKRSK